MLGIHGFLLNKTYDCKYSCGTGAGLVYHPRGWGFHGYCRGAHIANQFLADTRESPGLRKMGKGTAGLRGEVLKNRSFPNYELNSFKTAEKVLWQHTQPELIFPSLRYQLCFN